MKSVRTSRIILAVSAVFAAIVLLATYGTALPTLPFAAIDLDEPTAADSNGDFTAIADSASRRVLILNGEDDLTGFVDCTTNDSPIEAVTDVCVSGSSIFVAGVKYAPDSDIIVKERVVVYDKGGNLQEVVYDIEGTSDEVPLIKSLSDAPDGVVITRLVDEDDNNPATGDRLEFLRVDKGGEQDVGNKGTSAFHVITAAYSLQAGSYVVLDIAGSIEAESIGGADALRDRAFTAADIDDEGAVYACDDISGCVCRISRAGELRETVEGAGYDGVHANGPTVTIFNREGNEVAFCDAEGALLRSFTSVVPSAGFTARMVLVWVCGAYLVVLALAIAIRGIRRRIAAGEVQIFGPMLASAAVVAAMVGIAVSLSFASYNAALATRSNEIGMLGDYLASSAGDVSEAMQKCNDRIVFRGSQDEVAQAYFEVFQALRPAMRLVDSANENKIGAYYALYGKDDEGIFYIADSSLEHVAGTSVASRASKGDLESAFAGEDTYTKNVQSGRMLRDSTRYRLVPIPSASGEGVAGVIEVGSKIRSFEALLNAGTAQRILAILVLMLVVYLTYSELRACGRCLYSRRELRQRHPKDAIAVLTRPFTFAITMLTSIDGVMTVLIARELLSKIDLGSSPLLGLPAVMLGIGLISGQMLYGRLGSKVGLRRLMAVGAGVMLLCAVFAASTVVLGNFWLYCVAKLTMSVPFGLLYTLGYSMPRSAESDEVRKTAAGGVKRTDTSAAALGTVIGGYAAQTLGNEWVYALIALACVPVIAMALSLLPKNERPIEPEKAGANAVGIGRFAKTPVALGLALFVVLPATVAAGYTSFLFPLFTADLGLSKAETNNIYVLGQLVVYLCITRIEGLETRHGRWRVSTTAIALLGVVFLLFSINTTLLWSIAVIPLIAVLCKSSDGWKAMWLSAAGEAGVQAGRATGAMFALRSLTLIVQPFILSSLLGATDSVAVIVIGILCVISAFAFFMLTRKTSLAA